MAIFVMPFAALLMLTASAAIATGGTAVDREHEAAYATSPVLRKAPAFWGLCRLLQAQMHFQTCHLVLADLQRQGRGLQGSSTQTLQVSIVYFCKIESLAIISVFYSDII